MNTRQTAVCAMIFTVISFPVFGIASDGIQVSATGDGLQIAARSESQNNDANVSVLMFSRYYGAHSPQGETDLILDQVQDLITFGNLSRKTGVYLQVLLKAAKNKFDQGNDNTAINHLQAFIHLVNDFVFDGQLFKEDGQELIESAQFLIEALQV